MFNFFLTTVLSTVLITVPAPANQHSPILPTRKEVIISVKQFAQRHYKYNKKMETGLVLQLFQDNGIISTPELGAIYETEYSRLAQESKKAFNLMVLKVILILMILIVLLRFLIVLSVREAIRVYIINF